MQDESIYATPRVVTSLRECTFYHTMDIPGYGCVKGPWDLRQALPEYLGNVDFRGKRVLDIGTASGFLSFYMESEGADVVAYDLSEHQTWDVVPFSQHEYDKDALKRSAGIRRINNSFWLCHNAYKSKAKMVYGSVYKIPEEIGDVDISVFAAVLLHLRDPFLALHNALRLTRERVIITELASAQERTRDVGFVDRIISRLGPKTPPSKLPGDLPLMEFFPDYRARKVDDAFTWWRLTPEIIRQFIGVLGFEKSETSYHAKALASGQRPLLYTIVGQRTRDWVHYEPAAAGL